ncbi:MAG: hypothetical protein HQ503_02750 [Rhodospirillales bacterium]|nr:hypothetical protein [Rhodospirillales bacterium]
MKLKIWLMSHSTLLIIWLVVSVVWTFGLAIFSTSITPALSVKAMTLLFSVGIPLGVIVTGIMIFVTAPKKATPIVVPPAVKKPDDDDDDE